MFSVLTLNLRFGLADDGKNSWQYRKKAFPLLLEKYPADFVGFQEVNTFQADFLRDILKNHAVIGKRSPAPHFWQNNLIFYHHTWKCIHRDHFFLSVTPTIPSRSRKSRWPRQCTIGMFQKRDRKLICINTHFDFDATVQTQSAEFIMHRLADLPADLPAVLMGDFNNTPQSGCYKVFTGQNGKSVPNGPYFKSVFSPPFPGTHHGFTGSTHGDYIDWILCRGNVSASELTVIREKFSGIYPSDHFPIHAKFVF